MNPQLDSPVVLVAAHQATAQKALLRQRFGVRVPGGAPVSLKHRYDTEHGVPGRKRCDLFAAQCGGSAAHAKQDGQATPAQDEPSDEQGR